MWQENDFCDDLKMPLKNEFVATDFSLVPIDQNVVKLFTIKIYIITNIFSLIGSRSSIYYSRIIAFKMLV